jgi:hypothetical protein
LGKASSPSKRDEIKYRAIILASIEAVPDRRWGRFIYWALATLNRPEDLNTNGDGHDLTANRRLQFRSSLASGGYLVKAVRRPGI